MQKSWLVGVWTICTFLSIDVRAADDLGELSSSEVQEIVSQVPGVQLVSVERRIALYADFFSDNTLYQFGQVPEGATNSVLGIVAYVPFDGGRPLYSCLAGKKRERFSSLDEGCEGQRKPGARAVIGYVSIEQREGTIPLYRCLTDWNGRIDHFDSLDVGCEGYPGTVNEGLLGFIWPVYR